MEDKATAGAARAVPVMAPAKRFAGGNCEPPFPSGLLPEKPLREQPILDDVPNLLPVGLQ